MNDQQQHWNSIYSNLRLNAHSLRQSGFAKAVSRVIPKNSHILELGCGAGSDSVYFAKQGHTVLATDFSSVAIEKDRKRWSIPGLEFTVQDISKPFKLPESYYDLVYARLSLHYFTNEVTQLAFREVNRVLGLGGYLCFMCKSVDDPLYGQGIQIEPDMFELAGHVRHFFSKEYAQSLLVHSSFTVDSIKSGEGPLYNQHSAFILVVARKAA